jgi:uncharacterized membrane protein
VDEAAEERPAQRWETGRVEAFSDAVFAIAITLLVLEIKVDPSQYDHLGRALAHEWPAYLAYVTSFLTVGGIWLAHHNLFTRLRYVDQTMMRINLLLLMVAAFLPFPTGILAQALHSSDRAARVAIGVYGLTAILLQIVLRAALRHAAQTPDLADPAMPLSAAHAERRPAQSTNVLLYGAVIALGILFLPKVAAGFYLVVAARGALVADGERRLRPRRLRHARRDV